MTHPGVGPITALAYVLTIGDVSRLSREANKEWPVILGLIPRRVQLGRASELRTDQQARQRIHEDAAGGSGAGGGALPAIRKCARSICIAATGTKQKESRK